MNRYHLSQLSEKVQSLLDKMDGLRLNQSCDCRPSCELENVELEGVVYSVITRAVDNLINYYTKTETNALLSSIHQFVIRQVDTLPEPSVNTMHILYLVPSSQQRADNVTDEFVTVNRDGVYVWEQIGASPVDLSDYVTESELNSALSSYVTSEAFSNVISGLSGRIDNLHEVKYTEQVLTNAQKAQARQNIGAGTYSKPSSGIPSSDLAAGVIPDVSQFITKTVNDLVNYYTKSETYTKAEVQALIAAINQFHYEVYESLSDVTDPQSNVLYLIGPTGTGSDKYEEYVFTTEWVKIGDTSINLSGYVTTEALNTALANYVTSEALSTILADYSTTQQMNQAIANADKVFVAVVGTTTAEQVLAAYNASKVVLAYYSTVNAYYAMSGKDASYIYFGVPYATNVRWARLRISDDSWVTNTEPLEVKSNKTDELSGNENDSNKYLSTKGVYDALPVFFATHGTTTYQQVVDAYTAGKAIVCLKDDFQYAYSGIIGGTIYFSIAAGSQNIRYVTLNDQNVWSNGSTISLQQLSQKVSTIEGNESNTDRFPNCKAVADALAVALTSAEIETVWNNVMQ